MRRLVIIVGLMGLFAGACQAAPKEDPAKVRAGAIRDAAPYIAEALRAPTETLYGKALSADGFDDFRLGLAMLAGRTLPPGDDAAKDEQALANLEGRVLPLSDAYFDAHPGVDWQKVDWVKVLQVSDSDLRFVDHYQQRRSADYWLSRAAKARNMRAAVVANRPSGFTDKSPPDVSANASFWPLIEPPVLLTAAACVRAARLAANKPYHGPHDLPLSILLLRADMGADIDRTLAHAVPDPSQAIGADACGTQQQFNAYVDKLKTAP